MEETDRLRRIVEKHFRIYDEREEAVGGETVARLYFVMFAPEEFDTRFEAAKRAIQAEDPELLVFMRRDGGEDILFVARRPAVRPVRTRVHLVLFLLTLLTTATAGALYWHGYTRPGAEFAWNVFWDPVNLFWGTITFALPLMAILGVHETAHYLAARRHGLRATLPYFLPVPPMLLPIGTLGAFIRIQDPLPDRNALFDVGASGPLAGFALAVPLLFVGGFLTADLGVEVPDLDRPDIVAEGAESDLSEHGRTRLTWTGPEPGALVVRITSPEEGWEYSGHAAVTLADGTVLEDDFTSTLDEGEASLRTIEVPAGAERVVVDIEWDSGLLEFGDPLIVQALSPIWEDGEHLTHPTFFAAWVGLLVTGINLLPGGQLDGGHVARAVLGERARWASLLSLAALMFLAFRFSSWILMALFLVLTGLYHPPPLNDRTPLDNRRKVAAAVVLAVLLLTFVPVPVRLV